MTAPPRPDRYGRAWPELPDSELCAECGQPDNCDDCNHEPYTDDEVRQLKDAPSIFPMTVWIAPGDEEWALVEMPDWRKVVVVPQVAVESHLPSSEWMATVANRAIDRVCALLGTSLSTRTRGEIVKHALATPPPAGPGGPNG